MQAPELTYSKGRGKETLFRVSLQNQVDHISIADSKANMIININTIIISVVIAVLGSGVTIEGQTFLDQKLLVLPMSLLMITCLFSAIFAVLATRPKIKNSDKQDSTSSLMYFGKISSMDFDQYFEKMQTMLNAPNTIYDNLIKDLYQQGVILKRKYWLVQIAYTIFIIGLSLSVLTFFIVWLFS